VIPDPTAKARLEAVYRALQDEINQNFPDSWVCLALVGDKLVVSGQAKDIAEATQILRILRASAPGGAEDLARIPYSNINLNVSADALVDASNHGALLSNFLLAGGPNVINLLKIPGEQQVQLRVTVAEVDRTAARSIGVNFTIQNNAGVVVFGQNTGFISTGGVAPGAGQAGTGTLANIPIALDNGNIQIAINALRELSYARTLAEPTLTTMNGQTASMQAGGSFPIPVIAANGLGGALQTTQFQPFGVQLFFTPYITDKDRIRLEVQASVSTRDVATGANIGGANVPGLTGRSITTTVELREGQTLAVAGLIQNNIGANSTRVPGLGDLPILGRLFSFDRLTAGEQELIILVTPELVHPLEPKEVPELPGSDLYEPGDLEFYVLGRLESRRQYDYRSPVRNDIDRMLRYRQCDQTYIIGPQGYADGRW
jgi:pilus assembly protein CpaC